MGIDIKGGDSGIGEVMAAEMVPPNPVEEVARVLAAMKLSRRAWPAMFPDTPIDAAKFWISKQEPCGVREGPEKVIVPKKKWNEEDVHYRFEYPYIERMKANLRVFMKEPSDSQRYILAAIEDGIKYRGDDNQFKYKQLDGLTLFQNIVKETERMRDMGVVAYRQESIGKLKSYVAKSKQSGGMAGNGR